MLPKAELSKLVIALMAHVRKPLPRGLKGTRPMPRYASVESISASGSYHHGAQLLWTAVTG